MKKILLPIFLLLFCGTALANEFYNATGAPSEGAALESSTMRNEFSTIEDGFNKFPAFSGNTNKVLAINGGGTAVEAITTTALGALHTVASHSDTTATGAELETLTDTSDASSLHNHTTANLNDTTATGVNLNTLTDGSDASSLHGHTISANDKNRVLNAEMMVDQRWAGVASTRASGDFIVDRFYLIIDNTVELRAAEQRSTALSTYSRNSARVEITTTETATAADEQFTPFRYKFLGYDVADLPAQNVHVSFYFKSDVTGTFSYALHAGDSSKYYVNNFTYSSADTVQLVSATIPIESSTTTITNSTTGVGLQLIIGASGGANNETATTGAWEAGSALYSDTATNWFADDGSGVVGNYMQIGAVQLRAGSSYVALKKKSYVEYLSECQAYYNKSFEQGDRAQQNSTDEAGAIGYVALVTAAAKHSVNVKFPVTMVGPPTITYYSSNAVSSDWYNTTGNAASGASSTVLVGDSGFTAQSAGIGADNVGDTVLVHYAADAEI